ncbi:MAG TPA: GNAT family N-acetyltransferase [Polyangiaceae bacterium]|nr:GNAT family N-acetyltransferase [Polyangiaceae bacterium]
MPIEYRFLDRDDPLREAARELRFRVLREPLGFSRADVIVEGEDASLHLIAVDDGHVVACVMVTPTAPTRGKLRQMAVKPSHQGTGLGRALVHHLEQELRARGYNEIELHAREHAVGFYEKLGYAPEGDTFTEVGLAHCLMRKLW